MAIVKGHQTLSELTEKCVDVPLGEDFLKQVRVILIQRSKPGAAEDISGQENLTSLFTSILKTAQIPTLSQPHRALSCDVISTWLIRSASSPLLKTPLEDSIWTPLVTIVLTHFDDAQSSLSKALKDLLGNILTSHPEFSQEMTTTSSFTQTLALQLLNAIHNTAGKKVGYYILETLVKKRLLSASYILTTFASLSPSQGSLVTALLSNLQDRTLSPSIGKALVSLLSVYRIELEDDSSWMQLWNEPLKEALRSEILRANVQIYVLPGLFKLSPPGFKSFVDGLGLARYSGLEEEQNVVIMQVEGENTDGEELMSLLCCLKVGKDLGYITEEDEKKHDRETKQPAQLPISIPSTFITPLLAHPHPHIRLAALTLLTHTPAATHPLPTSSLTALKSYLPPLHTETDAEVRNLVIQSIRGLIERLGSSSYALEKDLLNTQKKHQLSKNSATTHKDPKLQELTQKINEVKSSIIWYLNFLQTQLQPSANYQRVTTALRILTVLIRSGIDTTLTPYLPTDAKKKGLINWPVSFAGAVEVFTPSMRRVLLDALFNPFDDVRVMASEVLRFSGDCGVGGVEGLLERGLRGMNVSGRARDADGVALVLELWFEAVGRGAVFPGVEVSSGGFGVVDWTLGMLESYLDVARVDFQRAVRERPVHGLLSGLRLMFVREGVYSGVEEEVVRGLVERVFRACAEVWDITKGVLCDESPEGYMPIEEEEDEDLNTQTVMSYSWRGVKESSSLLGTILTHAPYSTTNSILTQKDFEVSGELLLAQLSNIRHRGAFSAVSPSFISLCTVCFKSTDPVLQQLPQKWLEDNLGLILSKSNAITRRSAGLPYLIIGILISETTPSRPLLHSTFTRLTSIATIPIPTTKDGEKIDLPQVHALNCMKFLFTDSRLSGAVGQYVGTGLELAVNCFGSEIWAIRNCGIMMFTTLLNRLFGTRRSRNDYVYMQSTFDTRGFFSRYPSVRGVLLGNLREKVGALEGGVGGVEMVYPALSLIARLDYAEGYEEMEEFEGLVGECMGSRIWKVREMAAKAYATLVGGEKWARVVERLLVATVGVGQNRVHGGLCAVRVLLERKVRKGDNLSSVWRALGSAFDALVRNNRCAVTKAAYLQILTEHAISTGLLESSDASSTLQEKVSSYCNTSAEALSEIAHASIVGRSLFKEQLASFMVSKALKYPTGNRIQEVITLLDGPDEEAALAIASILLEFSQRLELTPKEATSLDSTLWSIITDHEWDQLRVVALKLIYRYGTSETDLEKRWRAIMDLVQAPPTEPCKDAALATLGVVTEKVWSHFQVLEGGEIWAVWCLEQLAGEVKTAAHEDQPYPSRESALSALKALTPILSFKRIWDWKSEKEKLRGVYFVLYDMLNDDDEDIRDGAAKISCSILPGETAVSYTPLRAGYVLASEMAIVFNKSKIFFDDVADRLRSGAEDVSVALERVLEADTILFAREKQNLFVDAVLETEQWGSILSSIDVDELDEEVNGFVFWVIAGLMALGMKVKELGVEGALGWMCDEDVFALGTKVIEGLRVVVCWNGKGEIRDALWERVVTVGKELLGELGRVGGHELWVGKLELFVGA